MLQTVAIAVLTSPLPTPNSCTPASRDLMLLAIAWLQQRADGQQEGLLLIGRGFASDVEFGAQLAPYGLADCRRQLVGDDLLRHDEAADDIAALCEGWLRAHHPSAVPVVQWPDSVCSLFPQGLWWRGVEPRADAHMPYLDTIVALAPDSLKATAPTWCGLLYAVGVISDDTSTDDEFTTGMCAAQFARWLHAADAASGNSFFDFDYSEVFDAAGLDDFRLGYEARDADCDTVQDLIDAGGTPSELRTSAVRHLLRHRGYFNPVDVREELGDAQALLYSLYRCIWPRWNTPAAEAVQALMDEADGDPDIHEIWQFAADDDAVLND